MATIIDSLIVKLGFDSSGMKKGQADAKRGMGELRKEAKETDKSFSNAAVSALRFFAVISSVGAIRSFIINTVEANAALDRLSKNLQQNVNDISAWSNATQVAGGTAEGLQGTLKSLSKAQTELQLTGQTGILPYMAALGVSMSTVNGKARPVTDMLLDLADRFSGMDRTTAYNMGQSMGIDEGTMNLLLMGRKEVETLIARQKELYAVTKQQAEESARLRRTLVEGRQSFEALGRAILSAATPALEEFFKWLGKIGAWVKENSGFVTDFVLILAGGLAALGLALTPINLTVIAVTALAAAFAGLYDDYKTWAEGGDSLFNWSRFSAGIDMAKSSLSAIHGFLVDIVYRGIAAADVLAGLVTGDFDRALSANDRMWKGRSAQSGGGKSDAMSYFQSQGWSRNQAAGIVANLRAESGMNPVAVGDNGKAFGIAQWHPDRQAEFKRVFGKDIRQSSLNEQLAFVQYELTQGNERAAGNKLRGTTTAADAAAAVSRYYERPLDATGEAAKRARIASGITGASGFAGGVSAATAAVGNTASVSIGNLNVYSQAKDAAGIAADVRDEIDYTLVNQANYGMR